MEKHCILSHSSSLFDVPGTEAFASENLWLMQKTRSSRLVQVNQILVQPSCNTENYTVFHKKGTAYIRSYKTNQ